jgi:DNA polymerase III alpha subunit
MYLDYKTEFSMGAVFAPLEKVVEKAASMADYAGIADLGNTYGHVLWDKACRKHGIKPIFGVRLPVVEDLNLKERSFPFNWMVFIAKNNEGLKELYRLVSLAHEQFYYLPRLSYGQIEKIRNILLFSTIPISTKLLFNFVQLLTTPSSAWHQKTHLTPGVDNYYIDIQDKAAYEAFAEEFKLERKTTTMHIPTQAEWTMEISKRGQFSMLQDYAKICDVTLPSAPMVKYQRPSAPGDDHQKWVDITLNSLCRENARKKGISLSGVDEYATRYSRELAIVKEKKFQDYFLVVADLVAYAKTKMCVGPARGSAAGSLICYLLGITEVDPIKYDLYFERFIDLNRDDLPDIDIDFQDDKRHLALRYLEKEYGKKNVAQIANIGRLKPKSALNRVAKNLHVSLGAIEEIKNSADDLQDAFENTELGRNFIKRFPAMKAAADLVGHASYIGKHAAGVLVCSEPVHKYCGIGVREKQRVAMIDKRDAEVLNLLKIDALGLRTLSIIAEVCDDIGKPYSWIYELPTDDSKAYEIFKKHRFSGIFQFEGDAVQSLAKKMPIESIEDISAVSALGRPGPLGSGAAWDYVRAKTEGVAASKIHNMTYAVATMETYGVIVYQEQVMRIARELGNFSWADTGKLRKVIAKSKGDEIVQFKEDFVSGAVANGMDYEEAKEIWDAIQTFGGYAFNKSHSVSYGLISYYCAYLKAHYPLEFTKACLNHSKDDNSALRILRDAVENEGVKYRHIDIEVSVQKWSVKEKNPKNYADLVDPIKLLLGGFLSIHGIGPAAANKIVKLRKEGSPLPKGIQKHLDNDISPFKYLYPAKQLYGDYYTDYRNFGINNPVVTIEEIKVNNGTFNFLGKLTELSARDLNEARYVSERGGTRAEGQTAYLIFTLEDDTDSIRCKIRAEDYLCLGKEIVESGKVDEDWYLARGLRMNDWNIVFIENIRRITR